MAESLRILVLGASYGSLFGIKCAAAGHAVDLVCLPAEAEAINRDGATVLFPLRDAPDTVSVDSRRLPGRLAALGPRSCDPSAYDLVVLAMQEPQYRADELRELLQATARSGVPCLSIMNMPPLPYLYRIPGVDPATLRECYTDASVWDDFDPELITLCSPDPQALRLPDTPVNVLHVRLATNFKAAAFAHAEHTALLRHLERDIAAARVSVCGQDVELPVKLRVHPSVFVPLAKWCMLLTGNYRCVQTNGVRSIADAVHSDPEASRAVYAWVSELCGRLGASAADLVPFDRYAAAASSLTSPSSAARALAGGACHIERVDRLVQSIGARLGRRSPEVDRVVARVDAWLARNQEGVAPAPGGARQVMNRDCAGADAASLASWPIGTG